MIEQQYKLIGIGGQTIVEMRMIGEDSPYNTAALLRDIVPPGTYMDTGYSKVKNRLEKKR